MPGVIKEISAEEIHGILGEFPFGYRNIIMASAANSSPLWAGFWDTEPLCVLGLIPPTLLSETAYLWLSVTPEASKHKTIFGRWAKRMIPIMLAEYPNLVGHCISDSACRWLESLGAEVTHHPDQPATFRISSWLPQ